MNDRFDEVYTQLRAIMMEAAPTMSVAKDLPGSLELRTGEIDPKTKQPGWFGTVSIKKSYVSYHLMPLYTMPHLADSVSDLLSKRRQGKTCFNFTRIDEGLLAELADLSRACAKAAQ